MKFLNKIFWIIPFVPSFAFAAVTDIDGLIDFVSRLINLLIPIVVAAALLFFLWGLARFILASGSEVDRKRGQDIMFWGIIALFVMVSVWGIVGFIQNSLIEESGAGGVVPDLVPGGSSNSSTGGASGDLRF